MLNDALYIYGVVRSGHGLDWRGKGIAEKDVHIIAEGKFGALVHDCEEKPYPTEDPNQIKEMIIAHNEILNRAMEDFEGAIPLPFNTIIKNGTGSAQVNLKKWLNDDQERLERLWNKIKGKKEYGLRVYYAKEKLVQEASVHKDIKKVEENSKVKGPGLSYLLQGKAKAKTQEVFQEKANKLKQEFFDGIKKITTEIVNNSSRISLWEKKDLLFSLSILIEEKLVSEIKEFLEKRAEDFPYNLAGPFAPYSFVESGWKIKKMENSNKIGIVELIDRTLNKGVILNADLVITVADVPLLAANLKLALASVETMLKYGVMNDWLKPTLLKSTEFFTELVENSGTQKEPRFLFEEREKKTKAIKNIQMF